MWVPKPDFYIVRPCVNLAGMSRGAQIRYLEKETTHLPPGHFWCEIFEGRHISVDFKLNNKSRTYSQDLTVEGFRDKKNPLWKFDRWIRVNEIIKFPKGNQERILNSRVEDNPLTCVNLKAWSNTEFAVSNQ